MTELPQSTPADPSPLAAPHYVLVVTFDLQPGGRDAFVKLAMANARESLAVEPGCQSFDVLVPADHHDQVVLYEFYTDRAAFDDHCRRPHFLAFDTAVGPMVRAKRFIAFDGYGRVGNPPLFSDHPVR